MSVVGMMAEVRITVIHFLGSTRQRSIVLPMPVLLTRESVERLGEQYQALA